MRNFSERVLLILCIIGAASLLALTLLAGMPKTARAADPVVQLEFFDEEHGNVLILIGTSISGTEKIESCGEEYPVTWAAEPDGRKKASFEPQGACDSATVVTPWQKEFVDSSTNWKAEGGFLIREFWPQVEIEYSDSENGTILKIVATNLSGEEDLLSCDEQINHDWFTADDGRKWLEYVLKPGCDSVTVVTSLEKVFTDSSEFFTHRDGFIIREKQPVMEIEFSEENGGDTVVLTGRYMTGSEKIESCGEQFEVDWDQFGQGPMAKFTPEQGCGSLTVVTSNTKVFTDSAPSWDVENGFIVRKSWPKVVVEFFDEEDGNVLIFIGENLEGNEQIESCGQRYDVQWSDEPDDRLKARFPLAGTCDSATIVTSLQKSFIDSSENWRENDGFVVREFWPENPEEEVSQIEVFDEDNGWTLIFIGTNLDGNEQIESCGINYFVPWTEEADGRMKARFELHGNCLSATVIKAFKVYIDSSENWRVDNGFVIREQFAPPAVAIVEFFDEDNGNTLVFLGENLNGDEQVESCGVNYDVDWTLEEDGRHKARFTPVGTCESATVVTQIVKEWIDSSEFWSVEEGFVVKDIVVDPGPDPDFPLDLHLPYVRR